MKKLISSAILFLLGIFVCALPHILEYKYQQEVFQELRYYYDKVDSVVHESDDKIPIIGGEQEQEDALYKAFREYNEMIYNEGQLNLLDPFSFETASFDLTEYGLEENIVGDIYIERLNLTLPIYLGATKENMSKGATLLGCTSIPIGGNNTNAVICAHRGYSSKEMFRNINKLEIGDKIVINNFWEELVYEVIETRVIYPDEIENIVIQDNKDLLTLSSCHPYRFNYQRYIVIAERTYP